MPLRLTDVEPRDRGTPRLRSDVTRLVRRPALVTGVLTSSDTAPPRLCLLTACRWRSSRRPWALKHPHHEGRLRPSAPTSQAAGRQRHGRAVQRSLGYRTGYMSWVGSSAFPRPAPVAADPWSGCRDLSPGPLDPQAPPRHPPGDVVCRTVPLSWASTQLVVHPVPFRPPSSGPRISKGLASHPPRARTASWTASRRRRAHRGSARSAVRCRTG